MKKNILKALLVIFLAATLLVSCSTAKPASETQIKNSNVAASVAVDVKADYQTQFIMAGPGQDASRQAIISWHSPCPTSTLEYTDAYGTEFKNSLTLEGVPTESDWEDRSSVYRYRAVLSDLVPGSTYRYRVREKESGTSEVCEFRTAGTDGTFSFAWLSDIHAKKASAFDNAQKLLEYEKQKADISFCLFTGDMVNQGKRYRYWESCKDSGLLTRMQFAFVIGNHEYYPNKKLETATNSYYLDFAAIPDNHGSSPSSDYWFLYNNVLFICLDTIAAQFYTDQDINPILESQAKWLEETVRENEGKYKYLIVAQHYAFLDGDVPGTGYYNFWYPIFDRCKVDLALASDTHAYSRSKVLFNDNEADSGTVYMTSPKTEGSKMSGIISDDSKLGTRSAFNSVKTVIGGSYVEVTPESLTVHVLGENLTEFDSVTIPSRLI